MTWIVTGCVVWMVASFIVGVVVGKFLKHGRS